MPSTLMCMRELCRCWIMPRAKITPHSTTGPGCCRAKRKRSKFLIKIAGIRDTLASKQPVPLEKMIDGVIELVGNLDFTDKKAVIRKLVTKIVAIKKEINIMGSNTNTSNGTGWI